MNSFLRNGLTIILTLILCSLFFLIFGDSIFTLDNGVIAFIIVLVVLFFSMIVSYKILNNSSFIQKKIIQKDKNDNK